MDANQVNNFFAANSKYFTAQQCADLRNQILQLHSLFLSLLVVSASIASISEMLASEWVNYLQVVAAVFGLSSICSWLWMLLARRITNQCYSPLVNFAKSHCVGATHWICHQQNLMIKYKNSRFNEIHWNGYFLLQELIITEILTAVYITKNRPRKSYQHIDQDSRRSRQTITKKSTFLKITKTLKNKQKNCDAREKIVVANGL